MRSLFHIEQLPVLCFTDESRQEYRELQESFLKLQQERQKLLEKIASLESQLLKQDHELLAIHVRAEQDYCRHNTFFPLPVGAAKFTAFKSS